MILGSGWAAISLVSALNLFRYDVTLVSPRNYFLFTPLLSDAAVGSVSAESIVEPVRNFLHGGGFSFVEASATSIDPIKKTVQCNTVAGNKPMTLEYDKLVVAVGSVHDDGGVKGVRENTLSLRDLEDAVKIRNSVVDRLEQANSPLTGEDEKKRLLHFVVVGGSAIASEAAADLHDYVAENIASAYPQLEPYFKVTIIDSKSHIHNFYDKSISKEMRRYFRRPNLQVVQDAKVTQVGPNQIQYTVSQVSDDDPKATPVAVSTTVPFGLCVWSTGNAIHPLVQDLRKKIDGQHNERALVCDASLRVQGTEDVFALGDCATVDQALLVKKWADVFEKSDVNKDGTVDLEEYLALSKALSRTYPAMKAMDEQLFQQFDTDHSNTLTQDEFKNLMNYMDKMLTRFPATAAVAAQQGSFLADHLNKGHYDAEEEEASADKAVATASDASDAKGKQDANAEDKKEDAGADKEEEADPNAPVFRYKHIGGYEYVGAEDGFVERGSKGAAIVQGPGAMWMWRAIYFSRVASTSMRLNILWDWIHNSIFGSRPTRV